jgi:hypothetical protein
MRRRSKIWRIKLLRVDSKLEPKKTKQMIRPSHKLFGSWFKKMRRRSMEIHTFLLRHQIQLVTEVERLAQTNLSGKKPHPRFLLLPSQNPRHLLSGNTLTGLSVDL